MVTPMERYRIGAVIPGDDLGEYGGYTAVLEVEPV
jgi:hypothetical protein